MTNFISLENPAKLKIKMIEEIKLAEELMPTLKKRGKSIF